MMQAITTNWNFFRAVRLVLGIAAMVQAIMLGEWLLGIAGLFIAGMALANKGCGFGGCPTPGNTTQAKGTRSGTDNATIQYEEIK